MKENLTASDWVLAITGILYGILKLGIGALALFAPDHLRREWKQHKVLNFIISTDTTISAKMIEIALMVFGIYTLAHGLDTLGVINTPFIHTRAFIYFFYTVIGLFLIVFYSLVVYTSLDIPKEKGELVRYKIVGLVGGILFLIMTPLYILYHQIVDYGSSVGALTTGFGLTFIALISVLLMSAAMVMIIYDAVVSSQKNGLLLQDILSLLFIPLGFL